MTMNALCASAMSACGKRVEDIRLAIRVDARRGSSPGLAAFRGDAPATGGRHPRKHEKQDELDASVPEAQCPPGHRHPLFPDSAVIDRLEVRPVDVVRIRDVRVLD